MEKMNGNLTYLTIINSDNAIIDASVSTDDAATATAITCSLPKNCYENIGTFHIMERKRGTFLNDILFSIYGEKLSFYQWNQN